MTLAPACCASRAASADSTAARIIPENVLGKPRS
eukprot:CAMPEP_0168433952 /NCGR_PEP_ID=MMETSP0228-20121227/39661_1 /TAXON_ID=133427 /ORGANISM="Protoceratium reticulatum, Strain CCCM 535 (=CCMP 1889)" /LENGTH=33 /DNA_ID= /DNA_START= /DNA_END= /DNA_ORIENTATION=